MIAGALAFLLYAFVTIRLIMRYRLHAGRAAFSAIAAWLICTAGAWLLVLRR